MRRTDIKRIIEDITPEQLNEIMDLSGLDIEKEKNRYAELERELEEKTNTLKTITAEFESLKASNADSTEWKKKFEALQAENDEKAKKAEADRMLKEKNASIESRFNSCVGEKRFAHEAIRTDYLRKFGEALESKDFEGASDKDILHALTKDDGNAWQGTKIERISGGTPRTENIKTPTKEEFKKMSYAKKLELYNTNKELYDELKKQE